MSMILSALTDSIPITLDTNSQNLSAIQKLLALSKKQHREDGSQQDFLGFDGV